MSPNLLINCPSPEPVHQDLLFAYNELFQLMQNTYQAIDKRNNAYGRCVPPNHRLHTERQYAFEFASMHLISFQEKLVPTAKKLWVAAEAVSKLTADGLTPEAVQKEVKANSGFGNRNWCEEVESANKSRWESDVIFEYSLWQNNVLAARQLANEATHLDWQIDYEFTPGHPNRVSTYTIKNACSNRNEIDYSQCATEFFAGVDSLESLNALKTSCEAVASLLDEVQAIRSSYNHSQSQRTYATHPDKAKHLAREWHFEVACLRFAHLQRNLVAVRPLLLSQIETVESQYAKSEAHTHKEISYFLFHLVIHHNIVYATELLKAMDIAVSDIQEQYNAARTFDKPLPFQAINQLYLSRNEPGENPREYIWGDRGEIGKDWKPQASPPYLTLDEAGKAGSDWDSYSNGSGGSQGSFVCNVRTGKFS